VTTTQMRKARSGPRFFAIPLFRYPGLQNRMRFCTAAIAGFVLMRGLFFTPTG
jgi:hypothetical protein